MLSINITLRFLQMVLTGAVIGARNAKHAISAELIMYTRCVSVRWDIRVMIDASVFWFQRSIA